MPDVYQHGHTVGDDEIDALGHANNVAIGKVAPQIVPRKQQGFCIPGCNPGAFRNPFCNLSGQLATLQDADTQVPMT